MSSEGISPERRERYAAAAAQAAAEAHEIRPGDDVALQLKPLFPDFPAWLAEYRAERDQQPETAA